MKGFIADENIPGKSILILREAGYDVLAIGEDFPALKDVDILAMANEKDRILITFDSDFGDLIFNKGHKCSTGIGYLRLGKFKANEPGDLLRSYLTVSPNQFMRRYSTVDRVRIRQIKL